MIFFSLQDEKPFHLTMVHYLITFCFKTSWKVIIAANVVSQSVAGGEWQVWTRHSVLHAFCLLKGSGGLCMWRVMVGAVVWLCKSNIYSLHFVVANTYTNLICSSFVWGFLIHNCGKQCNKMEIWCYIILFCILHIMFSIRGCSIITSRIGGGWVSAFFVMLRDGKRGGEWYFVEGRSVTVKKIIKPFFCTIVKRSGFH